MANARLKQARRRGSSRLINAAQSADNTEQQTPSASPSAQSAQPPQNEPLTLAQKERAALEAALVARKQALESQIKAFTLGKTLQKELEPDCDATGRRLTRCHRDFVLQEMEWMAADFAQERKWRIRNAKMLSQTLASHLARQEQRLARQERSNETRRRRVAARVGRDVKKFWTKIDKIIAFKVKLESDEVRQRQMQRHLKQLIEQTATYAAALATSFQDFHEKQETSDLLRQTKPLVNTNATSDDSSDDGVYEVTDEDEDDETTIEEEEEEYGVVSKSAAEAEVASLQADNELSIDALRAKYAFTEDHEDEDEVVEHVKTSRRSRGTNRRLYERTNRYKRPYLLTSRLELREYQEAGVTWLLSMWERRINGILADEMGLGKTIQTICLLAHLACVKGLWGPHLIVVPTSCLVNWEMEFKRWCPAFKVLTYFGSAKRRKELRHGWSRQNAFQVCITSYQLVVQDAHCFKRKKWYYLILDEAHNIKNWKSLRWQTLLTFSSQRRLLLTGTPLQNHVLELWALMHFLMPHVFASRKEFSYWFQNPLALVVEKNGADPAMAAEEAKTDLVIQLHGIIRPFVLRRLKKDVAKQLPGKFEHVITCQLSKRQRVLYEDFISRSTTRRAMYGRGKGRGANFMSMMNVLMQLRKVCNHPDLFEPRPIASPLDMPNLNITIPSRCGFLLDEIVNERPRVALWTGSNLPGLEFLRTDKWIAKRRRALFFYDVNVPLPADAVAAVPPAYEGKKDLVWRILKLTAMRKEYWEQKRAQLLKRLKLQTELCLDEPVYGEALMRACTMPIFISSAMEIHRHRVRPFLDAREPTQALQAMVRNPEERLLSLQPLVNKSICYVPKARAKPARVLYQGGGFAREDMVTLSRKARAEELDVRYMQPIASRILSPYYDSFKRTQLFFPDKALVQFDCGKLQQLAKLLRTLKRGSHRCLIFTQMSSMLNILEVFLNLHGHTYFRLDGATKVEKRQMLMERFNRDEKIFCFILSTRSGGLGINLTGADAVIFYDSDWNPAMDAQAQDRAHRIGQTRDVHIYRLVSEHTVEENILQKAQQKRQLDFLVMSEGQFTTDFFSKASLRELMVGSSTTDNALDASEVESYESASDGDDEQELSLDAVESAMAQLEDEDDVVAMKGARAEVVQERNEFDDEGGSGSLAAASRGGSRFEVGSKPSTPSSVRSNSTAGSERGEDEDDHFEIVEKESNETGRGLLGQRRTGRQDHEMFDDSEHGESMDEAEEEEKKTKSREKRPRCLSKDFINKPKRVKLVDLDNKYEEKSREQARDAAEEQKLQAWKASVQSLQGFEDSLNPVDRYALHFREDVDPLYAYTPAQQAAALAEGELISSTLLQDIAQIEAEKREEEARLIAAGELVVGHMDETSPELIAERYNEVYRRERAHVLFEGRKRRLTGAAWSLMKCVNTGQPFYYNRDTREATWECPPVWVANEQLKSALERGFEGLPPPALHRVLSMLTSHPERYRAQMVCRSWHTAAQQLSLFMKVSPSDFEAGTKVSLAHFLANVAPGNTVLFQTGVYELNEVVEITHSVRFLAVPDAHVEFQMHSSRAHLRWSARGGVVRGFYFTRTKSVLDRTAWEIEPSSKATTATLRQRKRVLRKHDKKLGNWQHLLSVVGDGQLRVECCEFDGNGLGNACVCVWGRGDMKKKRKRRKSHQRLTSKPRSQVIDGLAASIPRVSSSSHALSLAVPVVSTSPTVSTLINTSTSTVAPTADALDLSSMRPMLSVPVSTITRLSAVSTPVQSVPRTTLSMSKALALPRETSASLPRPQETMLPAADTLLTLVNCRIRGAGSSGVLLVRGSLVMAYNTVEKNHHSGVTILGGHALLRRNKIQRNGRFGLRFLYHAGNVIVEDNMVAENACGNMDVDTSGRRFIVRLNDMDKSKKMAESLPHLHGTLRLKTFRVVETEIPHSMSIPTPSITSVANATSAYWKQQLTGCGVSTSTSALTSTRPVVVSNHMVRTGIPMNLMQPGMFPQGFNALHVSHLPAMAFASLQAKATVPSMTLNRSDLLPTTRAPGIGTRNPSVTMPGTTMATIGNTSSSMTLSGSLKKPRKRRPKTQEVVKGGYEITLRDTCEKPVEKVVKPRRIKEISTPVSKSEELLQTTEALRLPFPRGSTAANVAAAMNAIMTNTTKLASFPSVTKPTTQIGGGTVAISNSNKALSALSSSVSMPSTASSVSISTVASTKVIQEKSGGESSFASTILKEVAETKEKSENQRLPIFSLSKD